MGPKDDAAIKEAVRLQFGAAAQSYVTSTSHAMGDDLQRLLQLAAPTGTERMLDVATGGGHTALAFAPLVATVTAIELTPKMLEDAAILVAERGATYLSFALAEDKTMPFGDATLELVNARIAPHQFAVPKAFIRESARARSGGLFLLDDNMAPEDDELDTFMNRATVARPGHVRAYRPSNGAWMQAAACASSRRIRSVSNYAFASGRAYEYAAVGSRRTGALAARRTATVPRSLQVVSADGPQASAAPLRS